MTIQPTKTEYSVLQNLHLKGCTGKMGSMNKKQRLNLLLGLVRKGWLQEKNINLTSKGIEVSSPKFD